MSASWLLCTIRFVFILCPRAWGLWIKTCRNKDININTTHASVCIQTVKTIVWITTVMGEKAFSQPKWGQKTGGFTDNIISHSYSFNYTRKRQMAGKEVLWPVELKHHCFVSENDNWQVFGVRQNEETKGSNNKLNKLPPAGSSICKTSQTFKTIYLVHIYNLHL